MNDYFDLYKYGTNGLRQGDADAVVGGLSSANRTDWITPYLDYVVANNLPLDFLSFHQYPSTVTGEPAQIDAYLASIKSLMAARSQFYTTELHLNEYNSYPINYPQGGTQDKFGLASSLLRDFSYFLSQPSLDKVNWAQFMDSGQGNFSGMVTIDGFRKAVFNAYKIYSSMPVDRKQITISGASNVGGFASADDHKAGFVLWNKSGASHTINATLTGIGFPTGTLRVYPIDASHASHGDNAATEDLVPSETYSNVATAGRTWSGTIPDGGVVYLEFSDGTGLSSLADNHNAKVLRNLSYRPDRNKTSYADFDPTTWTAKLGMASEQWADEEVGATVEQLPSELNFQTRIDGTLQKLDANSCACLRLDYQVGGTYTKSILVHGPYNGSADLYDATRSAPMPWGTKSQATQVIAVPNLASFAVNPGTYAPVGWNGRVQMTFLLQNSGVGTRMSTAVQHGVAGTWGFDETGGTAAKDSSGHASDGTITAGSRVPGVTKTALLFNGTSTSVNAGAGSNLDFGTGSFSASSWFKTTGTGFQRLISKGNNGNTNGYLLATSGGTVVFAIGAGGTQSHSLAVNTPGGFNDGNWHQVTVSVDGAAHTARVFVDAAPQTLAIGTGYCGTASGSTASISSCPLNASSSSPLTLGSNSGTTEFFAGSLDDTRLYARTLSAEDIRYLAGPGKAPVARWPFDDGGGQAAADVSGTDNHGVVTSPSWVAGQVGGALALNGSTTTVNIGNASNANFGSGSFTIATWFTTTGTAFQRLISKGNYGNTNGYLLASSGGTIVFALGANGNQAQSLALNTPGGLNNGAWHHVAISVDRSAQTVTVFVDGVAQNLTIGTGYCGSASGTTASIAACPVNGSSLGRLALGSYDGTTEYFTGSLDDVRFYNRPLVAGELTRIMAGD
jgi:hypothetical protein